MSPANRSKRREPTTPTGPLGKLFRAGLVRPGHAVIRVDMPRILDPVYFMRPVYFDLDDAGLADLSGIGPDPEVIGNVSRIYAVARELRGLPVADTSHDTGRKLSRMFYRAQVDMPWTGPRDDAAIPWTSLQALLKSLQPGQPDDDQEEEEEEEDQDDSAE